MKLLRTIITSAAMAAGLLLASAASPIEAIFSVQPRMHCQNCENKIKSNLRFEKGVKAV